MPRMGRFKAWAERRRDDAQGGGRSDFGKGTPWGQARLAWFAQCQSPELRGKQLWMLQLFAKCHGENPPSVMVKIRHGVVQGMRGAAVL